jgi:hypothetical protein
MLGVFVTGALESIADEVEVLPRYTGSFRSCYGVGFLAVYYQFGYAG